MSTYSMNCISVEDANTAYFSASRKVRRLREQAETARKIADALDGAYITKRLDARLRELLPDMAIACITRDSYSSRKYALVNAVNWSCANAWHIDLHAGDDNRVNAELIRKDAAYNDELASRIEASMARFTEIVSTYNALATAYAGIYDELNVFFSELVYADYSKRTSRK